MRSCILSPWINSRPSSRFSQLCLIVVLKYVVYCIEQKVANWRDIIVILVVQGILFLLFFLLF